MVIRPSVCVWVWIDWVAGESLVIPKKRNSRLGGQICLWILGVRILNIKGIDPWFSKLKLEFSNQMPEVG